ncbi:phosphoribosylglycinamide formyltransferase [Acididesulfobacillus acetoxydans]|nr:phosphoribosylglycinamide formyltransferase [Acididesulfobacillus acetoxydans]
MRTGVLASGRGSNLQMFIDLAQKGELPIELVAVGSDQAGAQALARARSAGIPVRVFTPADYPSPHTREESLLTWLQERQVELLLLAGYMRILGERFVQGADFPILNIHPSLLPAFPGLHAQRQALDYGVKVSGCTVHFVDEGLDSGPIIAQEAVPVLPQDTEETLSARILTVEHRLYPEAVRLLASGQLERSGRRVAERKSGSGH